MISIHAGVGPITVKTADFNHDNFLDLAVANYDGHTTSIFLGYGNGGFKRYVDLENGANAKPLGIAIADLNNDNHLDIVVANRNASNVGIFFGKGSGRFSPQITFSTGIGSTPAGLALADFNNDNRLDIVVVSHETDKLIVLFGADNETFINTIILRTGNFSGPYLVVANDFNNDKHLDIAVGNGEGNYLGVYLGDGNGNFSDEIKTPVEGGPYAIVAVDFNRDGILDIATANYDAGKISILFGNGNGTFREQYKFSTGNGSLPYAIACADFNRDNIIDIIVPNSGTDNIGILLGNGKGKFRNQKTYSTGHGSSPQEIAVGDFNGDGRLDFVSANYNNETIGVFLSTCS